MIPEVRAVLQSYKIIALHNYEKDFGANEKSADMEGGVFFSNRWVKKLADLKLPSDWANSVVLKNTGKITAQMGKGEYNEGIFAHELAHAF